jgi:dephospho-CoA kinase
MSVRIGITGPIGCGKSTVAGWLGELGATVIDADAVAREATALGEPALDAIFERFGEAYRRPDGSLDRAALGRLVFSDPAALAALEAIVHPAVRVRIEKAIGAAEAAGAPAVLVEAIKLVEGGLAEASDEVWLVTCEPGRQLERLLARGSDVAEASQRIAAQNDPASRLRPAATRIIDTSGDIEETRRGVLDAWTASGAG